MAAEIARAERAIDLARSEAEAGIHLADPGAPGRHLCGVAHARLGELDLARTRLTAAVAKREQLTHPGLPDTRAKLARLGG